jgi:predicted enzyme related to lactoylglutathione lyase
MQNPLGEFVWYELNTTDAKAAETFYRNVIGWSAKDAGNPGIAYTILSAGETGVAGLMQLCPEALEAGARPGWLGYIAVHDVNSYAERVKQAGGRIHYGPEEIPGGIGRFAIAADPYGAPFVLFKPAMPGSEAPERPAPNTPGFIGWHELHAGDGPGAFAFYSSLFGWTKAEALDMGAMGVYQLFATGGREAVGAMTTKTPNFPKPAWLYYFNVDGAAAAAERIKKNRGQVLMGPHEVPGGSWIIQCTDPQGVMFAAVAPRL